MTGTWRNLRSQIRAYFLFCFHFHLIAVPASLDTVLLFSQFLSRSFKAPQSILNYHNGVKFLHILLGFEFKWTHHYIHRLLFRGIQRHLNHVPERAIPMSPSVLRLMASVVSGDNVDDFVCFSA